ncbi:MAG: RDD family protein [Flavobacteriaceae bacterium]
MSINYAILPSRIKALIIDQIIVIAAMYGVSELFSAFEDISDNLRIAAFFFIFIAYEPLFISLLGGTIGHTYSNIAVKRERDLDKNISFPAALIRLVIKISLGWISLLTVTSNIKRKAIHDYVVNSVVIESAHD